ncbi:MAG: hypothetical protein HQM04_18500 [Magnetococcales bacterium]|nr:hypothetical protein [Magnetococcales bacterium]
MRLTPYQPEPRHSKRWSQKSTRDAAMKAICKRVAEGESLSVICRSNPARFPSCALVYLWCDRYPEYAGMMHAAHLAKGDVLADRILEVAEDESLTPAARAVRIGAYRWLAGKLNPSRWSERHQIDITSGVQALTDDQLMIKIEELKHLVFKEPEVS